MYKVNIINPCWRQLIIKLPNFVISFPSGNLQSDTAAADGLIRQYLKQEGQKRVVADRGFADGDAAIINMVIAPKSNPAAPYPGLEKEKFYFDADQDMLAMTPVGLCH